MESLLVGMIAGAIGVGYFIYGKKQQKFTAMICGLLLCIYPYFTDNLILLIVIGAALMAAPFFIDY